MFESGVKYSVLRGTTNACIVVIFISKSRLDPFCSSRVIIGIYFFAVSLYIFAVINIQIKSPCINLKAQVGEQRSSVWTYFFLLPCPQPSVNMTMVVNLIAKEYSE